MSSEPKRKWQATTWSRMSAPIVPPLKCQGIKTKLVADIRMLAGNRGATRWVEPFCGSCVVALNVQPRQALLCDSNTHLIALYKDIQQGKLTPAIVRSFLQDEGALLQAKGAEHYYEVRQRFNASSTSLDFLFLNRSCFNGVIRFNRSGKFNVPFGHKPQRFSKAYVTKITNQVRRIAEVISNCDWTFQTADFRSTLSATTPDDLVYCDPPYVGRHTDYFNSWSDADELSLSELLKGLACPFILSTWHSNRFRKNPFLERSWSDPRFHIFTREHFYHVGATEELRNEMLEALITNFDGVIRNAQIARPVQPSLL